MKRHARVVTYPDVTYMSAGRIHMMHVLLLHAVGPVGL